MLSEREKPFVGTWRHSHEEDSPTTKIYRGADFAFPPSRGRDGFELRADRTGARLGISARDGTARKDLTWQVRENPLALVFTLADGTTQSLAVVSIDAGRLEIRK